MIAYFVSRTELTSMITQSRSKDKRNDLTRNTGVNIRLRGLKKTERLVKMQSNSLSQKLMEYLC